MRRESGCSLVELLVATGVLLTLSAAVLALASPGQAIFAREPEAVDMQQRMRVASGAVVRDLAQAGAGASQGAASGGLGYLLAPVLPFRRGTANDDPPGAFTTDAITISYVSPSPLQTTLATAGPVAAAGDVRIRADPGCPLNAAPSCGFEPGMVVLLYDAAGRSDTFTVADVADSTLRLQSIGGAPAFSNYAPGLTRIVQLTSAVFSLVEDRAARTWQLTRDAGGGAGAVPVADHIVRLAFEYFGEPQPPQLVKPVTDPTGPWTTYGPRPPPSGVQLEGVMPYPAGENCTFMLDSPTGPSVPRLHALAEPGATALVRLTAADLTDGPWCPDPGTTRRWDADLLRVRRVAVTIRVQSANAALRGPAGLLFTTGGTSRGGDRFVPDLEMRFEVSPRNLSLTR